MDTNSQICKTRQFLEGRWFRVHNGIVDCFPRIVGADGMLIYHVLCRHARHEKICGMTVKRIADKAGIGRTKTFKLLTLLEENLLVRRQKVPGQTNSYVLLDADHAISVYGNSSPKSQNQQIARCPSADDEGGKGTNS